MKILIACEESQVVTVELRKLGHEAYSCDIEPYSGCHPEWHIQRDVIELINGYCAFETCDGEFHGTINKWDMIVAFPPCTHLAVSGARHFAEKRADGRQQQGIDFFMRLASANCERIAIENPIGIMSTIYRKPDQIIQPWQFGHGETKSTCLWLKGLPALYPTDIVVPEWAIKADGTIHMSKKGKRDNPTHFLTGRIRVLKGAQLEQWERIHKMPPGPDRAKMRSKTYIGIAKAMAEQWGRV